MAVATYRRLTRYAVFSVLQLVVFLAVLLLGVEQGLAGLLFVVVTLPLLWAGVADQLERLYLHRRFPV